MKYKEIEFKYKADNMKLSAFTEFCRDRRPKEEFIASGYDHFYDNLDQPGSFARHRVSPTFNELTFKRKTNKSNNVVRTEHNISLDLGVKSGQIEALCQEFGYKYNTSIFKNCFIYKFSTYTLVYYVVYDLDGVQELGRFFEIEMNEDHNWLDEHEALHEMLELEQQCAELGISAAKRIKRSVYEIVRESK